MPREPYITVIRSPKEEASRPVRTPHRDLRPCAWRDCRSEGEKESSDIGPESRKACQVRGTWRAFLCHPAGKRMTQI